jgi:hypothetical protein
MEGESMKRLQGHGGLRRGSENYFPSNGKDLFWEERMRYLCEGYTKDNVKVDGRRYVLLHWDGESADR